MVFSPLVSSTVVPFTYQYDMTLSLRVQSGHGWFIAGAHTMVDKWRHCGKLCSMLKVYDTEKTGVGLLAIVSLHSRCGSVRVGGVR